MNRLSDLYIGKRFLLYSAILVVAFGLSFAYNIIFPFAQALLIIFIIFLAADLYLLFFSGIALEAERSMPDRLSLGDVNPMSLRVKNNSELKLDIEIIDEIPMQFQKRDFGFHISLDADEEKIIKTELRPTVRGEYHYGDILLFAESFLSFFKRRIRVPSAHMVEVYPSIIQMKKFELIAFSRIATMSGMKKLRRIGMSYEFEKIKTYVQGDDIRNINWKATSRSNELMVNMYEVERSQNVYAVICKSREMMMPFHGLSLLDHSINTALAISNIALLKYDKMGLITFSNKVGTTLKASQNKGQLKKIVRALYNEYERDTEANYEILYRSLNTIARTRSLLFLFINFESKYALERALPHLRRINKRHLLVVIFFRNTEIESYSEKQAENVRDIFQQTISKKIIHEKAAMRNLLIQAKIQTILTTPEDLSMDTVNKYLELKSRGMI